MNLFLEICPYHAETLYPLVSKYAEKNDLVLINKNIKDWTLIKAISTRKINYSLRKLILVLIQHKPDTIYANTVTPNMYPSSLTEIKTALDMILIPIIGKLFGAKIIAVLHEAEFYLPIPTQDVPKRHSLFYTLFGKPLNKLYSKYYVLSPEVQNHLERYSDKLEFLSTKALSNLVTEKYQKSLSTRKLTWIGNFDSIRRNWKILTDIDPSYLNKNELQVDLICDINSAEGPDFLTQVEKQPEFIDTFVIREYRPDDVELLTAAKLGVISLCFYSNNLYGKTKTSGARHIALAFDKLTITSNSDGRYLLLDQHGKTLADSEALTDCLDIALQEIHEIP